MANLPDWPHQPSFPLAEAAAGEPQTRPRKVNRLRIAVFAAVFLAGCALSSIYALVVPAEYRAAARLEIKPASRQDAAVGKSFLTEVQILTSRPLLAEAAARLGKSGDIPGEPAADPVHELERALSTETVEGTQIVRLQAQGPHPELLPRLVNTLTDVYREHLAAAYKQSTASGTTELRGEIDDLDRQVAAKRQEIEAFRARYDIVSAERDENQLLSTIKGLGSALNDANSDVAAAEGHLRAVRSSIAAGQALAGAKDNPTLADIEQRASQLREQLHDLERRFTPQYLELDPAVKALRARLANLEQQMGAERAAGQRATLAQAQQQLTSAHEAVQRLQAQLDANKQSAQQFAAHLNEYKAKEEDLGRLEQLHRTAAERLANLEAKEAENAPQLTVLEAATVPQEPRYPPYLLAGIGAAASLVLALFAVRFIEFFVRREPVPQPAAVPAYWPLPLYGETVARQPRLLDAPLKQLPGPDALPRQLTDTEIAALLQAAGDDGRFVIVGLLTGLTAEELIALRWEHVDVDAGTINVPGSSARVLSLQEPLRGLVRARRLTGQAAPAPSPSLEELSDLVMCAAYDAGIADAPEVTPAVLRHTYVAFLLRQGIRLADIGRIVGRLPQDELAAHMRGAPPQPRVPLDQIDPRPPPLREVEALTKKIDPELS